MENCNYLIIISFNCGENFPINDNLRVSGEECDAYVVLEARFNDDVLRSDSIPITSTDPELSTELGFQVDRKQLHLFRIERKAIKLKCFLQYSNCNDSQFIGYIVIDLRNAQNYSIDPKYEWKTLLNPKYKGTSQRRPQVSIALMLKKLSESDSIDNNIDKEWEQLTNLDDIEEQQNLLSQKNNRSQFGANFGTNPKAFNDNCVTPDSHVENDINVRLKNGFYHIWDAKNSTENDCKLKFMVSITVAFAENVRKLFSSSKQIENAKPFHFRYAFLGTNVKTDPFFDIDSCDFQIERTTFRIATTDRNTLSVYFELHPTIEIQFCDHFDTLCGFVAISLSQFANKTQSIYRPIEGSFMLLPDDESIDISEPFPIVGISIELTNECENSNQNSNKNSNKNSNQNPEQINATISNQFLSSVEDENQTKLKKPLEYNESIKSNLNHYCFAIDLRNIRVIDSEIPAIDSCYLQFSYAFFGFTENIKTFPSMKLKYNNEITIPHGFCAFNFATTPEQLEKTFREIPLIIEVIEETKINTLIGTANVELFKVLEVRPNRFDAKQVVNLMSSVVNEEGKQLAQIQVIMVLQNYGTTQIPQSSNSPDVSVLKHISTNDSVSVQNIANLDDLIVETALEIELWKEKQLILFREQLKQNEIEYFKQFEVKQSEREEEVKKKISELTALENKLLNSLEELKVRENDIQIKESEIEEKQKEINMRYQKLNDEISEVISEIKENYEQRMTSDRNKLKEVEHDKGKYQEKVYFLERKLKEKDTKIKELEEQVTEANKKINLNISSKLSPKEQKFTTVKTLTRLTNNTTPKKVIITRDSQLSSRPNSNTEVRKTPAPVFPKTSSPFKSTLKPVSNTFKNNTNKMMNGKQKINDEKALLIQKIRSERKVLIGRGLPANDPIIMEIDQKLKDISTH